MTYEQGDNLLANRPPNAPNEAPVPKGQAGGPIPAALHGPLRADLTLLTVFSRRLRRDRMKSGAIDFSQSGGGQLKFRLNEQGFPVDFSDTPHIEIHDTIAELMILANSSAAQLIYSQFPSAALFRSHSTPSIEKLREVQEITQGFGLSEVFNGLTDEELLAQVDSFKKSLGANRRSNPAMVHLVTSMVIRAMNEARYISSENEKGNSVGKDGEAAPIRHYGLGLQFYTHFTSPIRRYADVIVHRQLLKALELQRLKQTTGMDSKATEALARGAREMTLPPSKAISILNESKWSDKTKPLPSESTHEPHMSRAPDGQKMYEKVSSTAVSQIQESSPPSLPLPAAPPSTGCSEEKDDDLDLLDSLLDGIGDDLLVSFSAPGPAPTLPAPVQLVAQPQLTSPLLAPGPNLEDGLDALLGDVNENSLSIAAASSSRSLPITVTEEQSMATLSLSSTRDSTNLKEISPPSSLLLPPYSSRQLAAIAEHLNSMNRRAKVIQLECQQLFLRHYFLHRERKYLAVVCALKENGFLAYVPALDFKGAVYLLTNDNSTVCCRPQLLSLPNSSGEKVTTPQCAGKIDLKTFPSHTCLLTHPEAGTGQESELIICPKTTKNPLAASGDGTMRLQMTQELVVSVSSSANKSFDGIPELCLQLWSTSPSSLKKMKQSDGHDRVMEMEEEEEERKKGKGSTQVPKCTERGAASLYHLLAEIVSQAKSLSEPKKRSAGANKKTNKAAMSRKIALQGTGRIAFGEAEDREYFSPMFHQIAASSSSAPVTPGQLPSEGNSALRGKALAMHQMQLWGEEWAEEEDLPYSESTAASSSDPQETPAPVGGFNMRKEVAIASQRVQKLKVAKRNSKY
jgi:hypothetical protein